MDRLRKNILISAIVILTGFMYKAVAQYPHQIVFWFDGGYSTLLENVSELRSPGSGGFGAGVGYEWQRKKFLLHTGVEFRQFGAVWKQGDFVFEQERIDTDTEVQAYKAYFQFKDNRDRVRLGYMQFPVMAGMQQGRFYFLAGAKVGLNLTGRSRMKNMTRSTGKYKPLVGEFENMPNHGFDTYMIRNDYSLSMGLNCSLAAEVGVTRKLGEEKDTRFRYRLAVYGEYGLLNVQNSGYRETLVLQPDAALPALNSLVRTAADVEVHPLSVGVKFTLLFGIEGRRPCRCEYY